MSKFVVHKFGGTSVGSATSIRQVVDIVLSIPESNVAVVVSALGGTPKITDLLLRIVSFAKACDHINVNSTIDQIIEKHKAILEQLLPPDIANQLMQEVQKDLAQISELVRAIMIMQTYNEIIMEFIAGHGEIWSAKILTEVLNHQVTCETKYAFFDARRFLIVEKDVEYGPVVQYEASKKKLQAILDSTSGGRKLVITGFICSTVDGVMTTLKRDGSDFTASICGNLLHASSITIWTDVSGVLSADPRRVPESIILSEISYQEAMELAYFGAKVIHPKTMTPAIAESIPIYIRNTFAPTEKGTKITHKKAVKDVHRYDTQMQVARKIVSGFSAVDDLALFNIEGAGMVGVHGISSRLFSALDHARVNVVLIAQASSEHSICFAVPNSRSEDVIAAVKEAFFKEIHHGLINNPEFLAPVSVIAAVGDNMSHTPGVCGRFFSALGRANINILAISQGSSERNTSVVVKYKDSAAALRAAHSAFFLSDQTISIGIMGIDLSSNVERGVGKALLRQYDQQRQYLKDKFNVDIRIRAVTTTCYQMILSSENSITAEMIQDSKKYEPFDHCKFLQHVRADHIPHYVIIDVSRHHASHIADFYSLWLQAGVHVISANINVAVYPSNLHQDLKDLVARNELVFDTEACLAIGVPIVSTIRNFVQTGDTVERVEFSCSQFLNDVFIQTERLVSMELDQVFADQLAKYESKMTMQDILEEMCGTACAKKAILIARELNLWLDFQHVSVDPCLEELMRNADLDRSEWNVDQLIAHVQERRSTLCTLKLRIQQARQENQLIRLIACINIAEKKIAIEMKNVAMDHCFYRLESQQCGIAFFSQRYATHPVVITGPIADSDITAGSLFGSLLNLSRHFGTH